MLSLEHLWVGNTGGVRCRMVRIFMISCILKVLGAFAKLGEATISFILSVLPSVRMEHIDSQ